MLSKLAFRNVKRSAKDYVIYLITVTLAFSFIFAFNLMGSSEEILNLCDVMNNFALVMYFVNVFIIFIVCFLIQFLLLRILAFGLGSHIPLTHILHYLLLFFLLH